MTTGGGLIQATRGVWAHSASHLLAGQLHSPLFFVSIPRVLRISAKFLALLAGAHEMWEKGQLLEWTGEFGLSEILQHPRFLLVYMQTPPPTLVTWSSW